MFILANNMRILRFPNVAVMAINFTKDVRSSLITETHLTEVTIVFIYPREVVDSKVVVLWQIIFL
jgi:hypothetical protein